MSLTYRRKRGLREDLFGDLEPIILFHRQGRPQFGRSAFDRDAAVRAIDSCIDC
jgi:hypothetical protein